MTMEELIEDLKKLMRKSEVKKLVQSRIEEFTKMRKKDSLSWFKELVFCILTANSRAELALKCVEELEKRNLILNGSLSEVEIVLRRCGHRFARTRARYIIEARSWSIKLKEALNNISSIQGKRKWLIKNIKGIGMKEASHFLRNTGHLNVAIIDRHILGILMAYNLVDPNIKGKTLTPRKYIEIENLIKRIAEKLDIEPGVLDLYMWYMNTGKVLK